MAAKPKWWDAYKEIISNDPHVLADEALHKASTTLSTITESQRIATQVYERHGWCTIEYSADSTASVVYVTGLSEALLPKSSFDRVAVKLSCNSTGESFDLPKTTPHNKPSASGTSVTAVTAVTAVTPAHNSAKINDAVARFLQALDEEEEENQSVSTTKKTS